MVFFIFILFVFVQGQVSQDQAEDLISLLGYQIEMIPEQDKNITQEQINLAQQISRTVETVNILNMVKEKNRQEIQRRQNEQVVDKIREAINQKTQDQIVQRAAEAYLAENTLEIILNLSEKMQLRGPKISLEDARAQLANKLLARLQKEVILSDLVQQGEVVQEAQDVQQEIGQVQQGITQEPVQELQVPQSPEITQQPIDQVPQQTIETIPQQSIEQVSQQSEIPQQSVQDISQLPEIPKQTIGQQEVPQQTEFIQQPIQQQEVIQQPIEQQEIPLQPQFIQQPIEQQEFIQKPIEQVPQQTIETISQQPIEQVSQQSEIPQQPSVDAISQSQPVVTVSQQPLQEQVFEEKPAVSVASQKDQPLQPPTLQQLSEQIEEIQMTQDSEALTEAEKIQREQILQQVQLQVRMYLENMLSFLNKQQEQRQQKLFEIQDLLPILNTLG